MSGNYTSRTVNLGERHTVPYGRQGHILNVRAAPDERGALPFVVFPYDVLFSSPNNNEDKLVWLLRVGRNAAYTGIPYSEEAFGLTFVMREIGV